MKCKICGGELLFQDGKNVCQNCGTVFVPDSLYENIEVYICYEELDASGRRTKDSIIAQEVYHKLEAAKITAFYERISADGVIGDNLEEARFTAIQKAKTILVLGTSVESFYTLSEKYGAYLEGKTVIPFCVDVNPGDIPKSISKVQAVNYTTIGWEKDLVGGLYNLLGREKELDTKGLYQKNHKKKLILIGAVIAVLLIIVTLVIVLLLGKKDKDNIVDTQPQTQETTQATEKTMSQQEIYDQAVALQDEGKLIEALNLFVQIPDHRDSTNKIKLIYAKYEGYYKSGDVSLHLDISDNMRADVEVSVALGEAVTRFVVNTTIDVDTITGEYRDNQQQTGTIELKLEDTGLRFVYSVSGAAQNQEILFALAEKSDKPIVQLDAKTLRSWLEGRTTYGQINAKGYELIRVESNMYADSNVYQIKGTEIYFTTVLGSIFDGSTDISDELLVGLQAPASVLLPSHIGQAKKPMFDGNILYWPGKRLLSDGNAYVYFDNADAAESGDAITGSTPVGVTSKSILEEKERWNEPYQSAVVALAEISARVQYGQGPEQKVSGEKEAENETHMLVAVSTTALEAAQRAWYKVDKQSFEVTFLREGPYAEYRWTISESLWFDEYIDFAFEFPNKFENTKPGSYAWDSKVKNALLKKAANLILERYPQEVGNVIYRSAVTENDTYILISVRTQSLESTYRCAWYKGNKKDGTVSFIKEGPYAGAPEHIWFKEYPDFAKEFPALYGNPDEVERLYLNELPYVISLEYDGMTIYTDPTSERIGSLPAGEYTIVEEQYDEYYNLWGRLESGEGWICIAHI